MGELKGRECSASNYEYHCSNCLVAYKIAIFACVTTPIEIETFPLPNIRIHLGFHLCLWPSTLCSRKIISKIGMCLKENYSDSPSNEYSRHYSAESEYQKKKKSSRR